MSMFKLDDRLAGDTLPVTDLSLCTVRLMNDANYPWAILIPQRTGLADLIDLAPADRVAMASEVDAVSRALKTLTTCDKLNIASLGNMVRQLHVHIIARFDSDAAWPGPVWGKQPAKSYGADAGAHFASRLEAAIREAFPG